MTGKQYTRVSLTKLLVLIYVLRESLSFSLTQQKAIIDSSATLGCKALIHKHVSYTSAADQVCWHMYCADIGMLDCFVGANFYF